MCQTEDKGCFKYTCRLNVRKEVFSLHVQQPEDVAYRSLSCLKHAAIKVIMNLKITGSTIVFLCFFSRKKKTKLIAIKTLIAVCKQLQHILTLSSIWKENLKVLCLLGNKLNCT